MTTNATVHDPVCHMDIDIKSAAGRSEHVGKTYYFCSPGCKVDFDADPEGVLKAESEYDHSRPVDHMMMMSESGTASAGTEPARMQSTSGGSSGSAQASKKPWWKFWA